MKKNLTLTSLILAAAMGLAACTSQPAPMQPEASREARDLWLVPKLIRPTELQAKIPEFRAEDIHRLEIIPYWQPDSGPLQPLSKVNGEPTTPDDTEILRVPMSAAELSEGRAIALTGLRPQQTYQIVAHAYSLDGERISNPGDSRVQVRLTNDDRPTVPTVLPLQLLPTAFHGQMPLQLALDDPFEKVDHVKLYVFEVYNGWPLSAAMPIDIRRDQLPRLVTLLHLKARTSYKLEVRARPADPQGPDLAVQELTWRMEDDDELATKSVSVVVR